MAQHIQIENPNKGALDGDFGGWLFKLLVALRVITRAPNRDIYYVPRKLSADWFLQMSMAQFPIF